MHRTLASAAEFLEALDVLGLGSGAGTEGSGALVGASTGLGSGVEAGGATGTTAGVSAGAPTGDCTGVVSGAYSGGEYTGANLGA